MRKLALIGTALAVAAGITVNVARAETTELNFGIIATEASTNLKTVWDPFLEAMAKGTGYKVNAFYASDYAGVIEAMRFKKVQVAWFGNKSAMEAANRSNGEIFAKSVDSDGNPGYWSHLIVYKDSPLQNLDDVLKCDKSINFGIGDPNSTSGFLVPTSFCRQEPPRRSVSSAMRRMRRTAWRWRTNRSMSRPTTAKICAAWKSPLPKPARISV